MFDNKAWTKPQVPGVAAMPEDAFKTRQEWFDFIKMHEIQHTLKKRLPNETKAAYENRINKAALDEIAKVNKESLLKSYSDISIIYSIISSAFCIVSLRIKLSPLENSKS